jgi:hypothetical protein
MAKSQPKIFRVRREDPDSEHFRLAVVKAESAGAARTYYEQKERDLVAYQLPPEELEAELKKSEARGRPTGRLVAHNQTVPYEVVSVEPARGG